MNINLYLVQPNSNTFWRTLDISSLIQKSIKKTNIGICGNNSDKIWKRALNLKKLKYIIVD